MHWYLYKYLHPFIFLLLLNTIFNKAYGQIYINELMSSNASVYRDPYTLLYSDWFELYNADSVDVNLKGYFLTDNLDNPCKYRIVDNYIVYAGQYIIFWADGGNWWAHTNFKLSSDGELVALFSPDTTLVDLVNYGSIIPDISYGKKNDGSFNWMYFSVPTPFYANTTQGFTIQSISTPPQFSIQGGFYSGSQQVEISSSSGAEIRYTTDGSIPTEYSTLYTNPIVFDTTLIIRARAFEPNVFPSITVTNTYFININHTLPIVSLVTPPDFLWDSITGIYSKSLKDVEIPVNFEFIDTIGNSGVNQLLGLQISGQVAYKLPQKMFNVYARNKYGNNNIQYKFFNSRNNNNFSSLILRNSGFPDNSSTLFRDAMMQQLVINELDIDYQDYKPVVLYLNGKYWGIYNIREKHSEEYLAANNGADPNNIDLLENYWKEPICGDAVRYNVLLSFLENCDINSSSTSDYIKTQIDYDNYLNYEITQIYYANTDWPGNNYRFWRPRSYKGKWRWLLYDVEFGFGLIAGYDNNTLAFVTDPVGQNWANPPEATWFFRRMLQNDEFRNTFIQRSALLLKLCFRPEKVVKIIDSLQANIAPEMPEHINRWKDECWISEWGQPYCGISSMPYWNSEVEIMREFAYKRPNYIYKNIMQYFNIPDTAQLRIESYNGKVILAGVSLPADSFVCTLIEDVPVQLEAIPDPGYHFAGWSGVSEKTESSISISLVKDTFLIANFIPDGLSLIPSFIDSVIELTSNNSPYYAIGDIVIDSFAVLIIDPGAEIRMPKNACFIVNGQLITNGTKDSPVYIHANTQCGVEKWGAICIYNATDTTILNNTILAECSKGHDATMFKAAVSAYNSNVRMDNVTINDAVQPFFSQQGNYIKIMNCKLRSESVGDIINIKNAKFCHIEGCDILGNELYDTDGIDLDGLDSAIVINNNISGFFGVNNDGLDIGENAKNILIENNMIFNCFDKGISVGQASSVTLKNNIIFNCNNGVAIKDSNSFAFIDRNTIYNCNYAVACYEKNQGHGGGQAVVINSIFAKSSTENFYVDTLSSISVSYSLSDTHVLVGYGNLFTDPLFINTLLYDFSLKLVSPCIDAGDPNSQLDDDGTRADIGALFKEHELDTVSPKVLINEINYHSPNWAEAGDWIELFNNETFPADISGWVFKDEDNTHSFYIPKGCIIPAVGYLVLCNDHYLFNQVHPDVFNVIYDFDFGLSNSGELLRLFDNCMYLIDTVRYSDQFPWPIAPDGDGSSLSLISPQLDNGIAESWEQSFQVYGTPGEPNGFTNIPIPGFEHSNEIFLYPNPSNGIINLSGKTDEDIVEFVICDLSGKILFTDKRNVSGNWLIKIDFSQYSRGLYPVTIKTINSVWHNKFILTD